MAPRAFPILDLTLPPTERTLDSRSAETPELDFEMDGRKLRIFCQLEEASEKTCRVYTRRKKFRLLEELLDVRVDVRIVGDSATIAA